MANLSSLKPFQPGHDPRRNTKGRPKGSSLKQLFREALDKPISKGSTKTVEDLLIQKIMEKALKGNFNMIKLVWNYVDGKPGKGEAVIPEKKEEKVYTAEEIRELQELYDPKYYKGSR